jgi:hypothetical protein
MSKSRKLVAPTDWSLCCSNRWGSNSFKAVEVSCSNKRALLHQNVLHRVIPQAALSSIPFCSNSDILAGVEMEMIKAASSNSDILAGVEMEMIKAASSNTNGGMKKCFVSTLGQT